MVILQTYECHFSGTIDVRLSLRDFARVPLRYVRNLVLATNL